MGTELEAQEPIKHHYDLVRDNEKKILKKLDKGLPFYSFYYKRKIKGEEIIYDTKDNLLSTAGIVLSKESGTEGCFFKVRKISYIREDLKKPSKKFSLTECGPNASPKDFAMLISSAINNSFSNVFTIDLAEVVRQTLPKMQIIVNARVYEIAGGTGYRGKVLFEKVLFRDLITRKKVKKEGVTFHLSVDDRFRADTEIVLEGIERYCKGLIPYKESRYETASRLLSYANRKPQPRERVPKKEEKREEE